MVGLTRGTKAAHVARATLESVALQTVDVMNAMAAEGEAESLTELRVDGGASRNDLLMQIQADLLQVPIVRPEMSETTAQGAAFLAGLGSGFWSSVEDLEELWAVDRVFEPAITEGEAVLRLQEWRRAVDRARRWARPDGSVGSEA